VLHGRDAAASDDVDYLIAALLDPEALPSARRRIA
jgi:hypothetical protein